MSPKNPETTTNTDDALGYPTIEKLLETEEFKTINESFGQAYTKLEAISQDSSAGLKKKKGATKAMQAYEITTELLNELLKIKYQIVQMRQAEAKKNEKK